jgi:uncharacterized protein (TIGR04255 family)
MVEKNRWADDPGADPWKDGRRRGRLIVVREVEQTEPGTVPQEGDWPGGATVPPVFPEAQRVELKRPPLELVVCQLRFPTVLALAANQPPEEFQRRIRTTYPVSRRQSGMTLEVGGRGPQFSSSSIWLFDDKESQWTVSLGADFLSLETKRYRRFEDYIGRFQEVVQAARDLYPIELRERLGLRYVDRISREREPNLPEDWPSRVRQELIGLRQFRGAGEAQMSNLEVRFAFGERILTVRSLYVDRGFPGVAADELVLDFDCYIEKRDSLEGLADLLHEFRRLAYNAFSWALGDVLGYFERAGEEGAP